MSDPDGRETDAAIFWSNFRYWLGMTLLWVGVLLLPSGLYGVQHPYAYGGGLMIVGFCIAMPDAVKRQERKRRKRTE